jgi:hypothetical protein
MNRVYQQECILSNWDSFVDTFILLCLDCFSEACNDR